MARQELLVDFITSLDSYGAAEGWPGSSSSLLTLRCAAMTGSPYPQGWHEPSSH